MCHANNVDIALRYKVYNESNAEPLSLQSSAVLVAELQGPADNTRPVSTLFVLPNNPHTPLTLLPHSNLGSRESLPSWRSLTPPIRGAICGRESR